jgi:hypothetical protein
MAFLGTALGVGAADAAGAAAATLPEVTVSAAALGGAAAGITAGDVVAGAGIAAAGGAAAAAGGGGGGGAPPPSHSIATTLGEASAIAQGASSLYQLAAGPGRINIPPSPLTPQANIDQSAANAEQQQLQREEAAAGLQSTVGTAGGQAGAILNPSTLSSHSLLGG